MGDATQNKNMKSSFFQPKKHSRVLSEPDYLQSAQSTSGNNELPSQTDDIEFASTAPTPIRILTRAAMEEGAVTNGGANGINVTGSATKDKINEPLNIGRTDNTPNNQTNNNLTVGENLLSDNKSRETIVTNPVFRSSRPLKR